MKVVNATPWAVRSSAISAKAPLTAESAVSIGEAANAGLYIPICISGRARR